MSEKIRKGIEAAETGLTKEKELKQQEEVITVLGKGLSLCSAPHKVIVMLLHVLYAACVYE